MKILKKVLVATSIIALLTSIITPLAFVQAEDSDSLFHVTIIAPGNANLIRRQWAQIFASNLQQLGIDAKVVFLGWTAVYDRALTPAYENVGKDWDNGGWDILALGWTPGLLPQPRDLYYGGDVNFFAPDGQNYPLWNNTEANAQLDTFITATDSATQEVALKAWQQIYYNEVPASQLMFQAAPAIVNPHVGNWYTPPAGGEGWLYFNAQCYPELLTRDDGKTRITYCTTGEIDSLLPPTSNSWYDTIINGVVYNGLIQPWPTLGTGDLSIPYLLTSWEPSADGFTWTFNCRQGVTWHDGAEFTADDVVYSLWALMNSDVGSQFVGIYKSTYGDNVNFTYSDGTSVTLGDGTRQGSITATDKYTVEAELPVLVNGKPYGYFDPYMLGFANNIIPKHIFENIAAADWKTSPFSTGQGSVTINGKTYTGPIGTGPYKWESHDPVAQIVHLVKNDAYWNKTGLESMGVFKITDYYIKYIADKTSAIAALKNGEVDILDTNYQMQLDIPSIDPSWGKVFLLDGTGRQEFGYNMQHPIFGTGVETPLGESDPSKAAEAARDVRTAFDFACPRQLIIDNLLDGYGLPGVTPMLPTQPFYDSSLTARPYDLSQAKHYLELAGYTVQGATIPTYSVTVGNSIPLYGVYTDSTGTPVANEPISLMVTTDNATYTNSSTLIAKATTDLNGFYSFTATPTAAGTYYYYIFDSNQPAGLEYTYLTSVTVSAPTTQDITGLQNKVTSLENSVNTATNIAYVAIAIAIILGIIAIFLVMRKK